jgi:hypothetical protein
MVKTEWELVRVDVGNQVLRRPVQIKLADGLKWKKRTSGDGGLPVRSDDVDGDAGDGELRCRGGGWEDRVKRHGEGGDAERDVLWSASRWLVAIAVLVGGEHGLNGGCHLPCERYRRVRAVVAIVATNRARYTVALYGFERRL